MMAAAGFRWCVIAGLLLAGCAADPGDAGSPPAGPPAAVTTSDLTGFWVRTDEAGSGNFGAMVANIAPAQLLPAARAAAESEAAVRAVADRQQEQSDGGVYRVKASCEGASIAFMMQHSGALDIVQNDSAVLVIPEHHGAQHIYLDGRPHPAAADWEPSGTGHSVGHWEDGMLVVSTVGMKGGGGIPAGGRKSSATELVEHFRLRDSQHMTVKFTWSDPAIYVQPHSYEFTYQKQPTDSYAFESWCDVTDPLQGQSIVIPLLK